MEVMRLPGPREEKKAVFLSASEAPMALILLTLPMTLPLMTRLVSWTAMAGPPMVFVRLPALPADMEWWMPLSAPLTKSFSMAPSGLPEPSPHECVVPSAPSFLRHVHLEEDVTLKPSRPEKYCSCGLRSSSGPRR